MKKWDIACSINVLLHIWRKIGIDHFYVSCSYVVINRPACIGFHCPCLTYFKPKLFPSSLNVITSLKRINIVIKHFRSIYRTIQNLLYPLKGSLETSSKCLFRNVLIQFNPLSTSSTNG